MAKTAALSGFPEWLPAGRIVEQHVLANVQRVFELNGFASIETRAVEPMSRLASKGEIDKEIYVLRRLQAEEGDDVSPDKQLGLHYDLTVPFARYVTEYAGKLDFPFKRYQIQKVWRGERPQDGRFREFAQADIDVVGAGELPFHYEVELPLVMAEALASLPIPAARILVNNRKVVEGFYRGLGLSDIEAVLRSVDKLDKIGPAAVGELLARDAGANPSQIAAALELASISSPDASFVDRVRALGVEHELLDVGLAELAELVETAAELRPGTVFADLKIARGLDYYTGSVYETLLTGHEQLGSICSGGRYDSLAKVGNMNYPGVGLSIGISRLVSRILGAEMAAPSRAVPTAVLVAVTDESSRRASQKVAAALRARGIPTDVAPSAAKFGKQIKYADKRGIPFVWFPADAASDGAAEPDQIKDIRTGEQLPADPTTWEPPSTDLWPTVS